jgi:hypothetical protein
LFQFFFPDNFLVITKDSFVVLFNSLSNNRSIFDGDRVGKTIASILAAAAWET